MPKGQDVPSARKIHRELWCFSKVGLSVLVPTCVGNVQLHIRNRRTLIDLLKDSGTRCPPAAEGEGTWNRSPSDPLTRDQAANPGPRHDSQEVNNTQMGRKYSLLRTQAGHVAQPPKDHEEVTSPESPNPKNGATRPRNGREGTHKRRFVHSQRPQKAPDLRKHCAQGGTRTAFPPLQSLGTPGIMRNPDRSDRCTAQSEAKSVDIVHTLFSIFQLQKAGVRRGFPVVTKRRLSA